MKRLWVLLVISNLVAAAATAASFSEDQILGAAFVAFQQPGVFTVAEIKASRELLVVAARQGDTLARTVIARQYQSEKFALAGEGKQAVVAADKD
ncbi:MAG: hypothetical protein M0Q95_16395 [Porticoccaceae bacterium]|jgi:hypothetical protein|nr:hypothetical protein [Porticoccaceae bacterium]